MPGDAVVHQPDESHDLAVVQAHGHPDAVSASLVGTDASGATWRVGGTDGAEHDVHVRWRRGPVDEHDPRAVAAGLDELHRVSVSALGLSYAMGEHGALRYAGSARECAPS